MEDKVLMITFMNGVSIPVEGRLLGIASGTVGLHLFQHATLGDGILINLDSVMNIREIDRKDLAMGPNRIITSGGRVN